MGRFAGLADTVGAGSLLDRIEELSSNSGLEQDTQKKFSTYRLLSWLGPPSLALLRVFVFCHVHSRSASSLTLFSASTTPRSCKEALPLQRVCLGTYCCTVLTYARLCVMCYWWLPASQYCYIPISASAACHATFAGGELCVGASCHVVQRSSLVFAYGIFSLCCSAIDRRDALAARAHHGYGARSLLLSFPPD